ncbi:MAG: YihY/virulence factor BrkB family protein [Bacteroidales bacterium]|nr:YihY/virulence factor BrkB family protein [Bacteroidales bacterium]
MGKRKETLHRLSDELFTSKLWSLDPDTMPSWEKRLVNFVKLLRTTFETFAENRMGFQCVALSYFVALATIPFAALLFAVTGGLGLRGQMQEVLASLAPQFPDIVAFVSDKANRIIESAQSGPVGLISALTFIWTILWLMFQVERVFNNVWCIRRVPRKIYKRFSFYLLAMLLLPFLVLIFGLGIAYMTNMPKLIGIDLSQTRDIFTALGWIFFYIITTFTLSAMYKFIPAAKVHYINAIKSATVCGVFFCAFQYLYLETQIFVSNLNGVYGALAAIPLFLIWTNISWQIIIYGAELCYSFQKLERVDKSRN